MMLSRRAGWSELTNLPMHMVTARVRSGLPFLNFFSFLSFHPLCCALSVLAVPAPAFERREGGEDCR